jgi:hypothetical protein
MSNPFKKIVTNAQTSKNTMYKEDEQKQTIVTTKSCGTCGAPRPKKSNLVKCAYCRQAFMINVQNFKSDS